MGHGKVYLNRIVLLLAMFSVAAAAAESPKLTFKFTTIKIKGAQSTAIYGINNAGAMVGSYVDSGGVRHGFKMVNGKVKNIDASDHLGPYSEFYKRSQPETRQNSADRLFNSPEIPLNSGKNSAVRPTRNLPSENNRIRSLETVAVLPKSSVARIFR